MVKVMVIVGSESATNDRDESALTPESAANRGSLATVEILGQSVLRRTIERLLRAGLGTISVFARGSDLCESFSDFGNVEVVSSDHPWHDATRDLVRCKATHARQVLILSMGPYVELDVALPCNSTVNKERELRGHSMRKILSTYGSSIRRNFRTARNCQAHCWRLKLLNMRSTAMSTGWKIHAICAD